MTTLEEIGSRLRKAREAAKITQASLAEELGCARVNVSQWESGTNGMTVSKVATICRKLKISADWLLGLVKK